MRKNTSSGFTIIEVLIVLAIGGVMLLLIFEVVPVLTRNSRNTQRDQDVQGLLQAVSHYELTHSGQQPSSATDITGIYSPHYYDVASISWNDLQSPVGPISNPQTDDQKVVIVAHAKCLTDSSGKATSIGADYTDIAALYAIESSSGAAGHCSQL